MMSQKMTNVSDIKRMGSVVAGCAVAFASLVVLGGCGSNNAVPSADFESKIRAPKGPPPPEAMKATQDALANKSAKSP